MAHIVTIYIYVSNTNLKNSSRGIQCHVISKYRSHSTNKKKTKTMQIWKSFKLVLQRVSDCVTNSSQLYKQFKFNFKKYAHTHWEKYTCCILREIIMKFLREIRCVVLHYTTVLNSPTGALIPLWKKLLQFCWVWEENNFICGL